MKIETQECSRKLREVLEREGIGPSKWRQRDCITLVRAVIRELSGQEPTFGLPSKAEGLSEKDVILRAPREYGSLRKAWLALLEAEPLLNRLPRGSLPSPGMIALTPARGLKVESGRAPSRGPLLGVIAPTCHLLVRTSEGLAPAWPVADLWKVK